MDKRQHMIDKCMVKMREQHAHKGWTEEQILEKATKWADQKIQENILKAARENQEKRFDVVYSLELTPAMMVAGELGIRVTYPDGSTKHAYVPFDFTNHQFKNIIELKSTKPTKEKKSLIGLGVDV